MNQLNKETNLMRAVRESNASAVIYFVEIAHDQLDAQNVNGDSALHLSIQNKWFDGASYLIKMGANMNVANANGIYPLHLAVAHGLEEIVKMLLSEGAWLEAEDLCGDTPLHYAVREEHEAIIQILLFAGADVNHLNEDNESPLELAKLVSSEVVQYYFKDIEFSDTTMTESLSDSSDSKEFLLGSDEISASMEKAIDDEMEFEGSPITLRHSYSDSNMEKLYSLLHGKIRVN